MLFRSTRRSILEILKSENYKLEERKISIDELIKALKENRVQEAFGTGTAAVVSPIGQFTFENKDYTIGDGSIGELTQKLYDEITGIQTGKLEDKRGWTVSL